MRIFLPWGLALLLCPAVLCAQPEAPRQLSLSLRQAIDMALATDPQLAAAVVNRERTHLQVLRSQLDRVSLRVDANLQEQWRASNLVGSLPFDSAAVGLVNASSNLQVPLFTGFRVTANVERSKRLDEAAQAQVAQERRRLALDVLRSYWAIRRVELQRAVSAQALGRYEDAVQVVGARVRAGLAPPVEVNRIETRRQRELARLADLDGSAMEARAQLAVALGLAGPVVLTLTDAANVPPPPPEDPAEVDRLLQDAQRGRPDLMVARKQVLAAKELVRLARSGYYPQLSGVALLQFGNNPFNPLIGARAANDAANPFANITGSAFFGATLSLNLFDTLNTYTQTRDARYEVQRLMNEERRLGRLVESDVRSAHARLVKLYRMREPLIKNRDLAEDTLGIIERRYKNGEALILDYIDSQFELLSAEMDLASSAASIALTWGELWLATGRVPE